MTERRGQRHPASQPDNADFARVAVEQERQVRDQLLREHVAAVRGIDLPVDSQRNGPGQTLHGNRGRSAFLVIKDGSRLQECLEVEILRDIRRIQVDAAREQCAIPRTTPDAHHGGYHQYRAVDRAGRLRQPAPCHHDHAGGHQHEAHRLQGLLQPEDRNHEEAGGKRTADGARCVDRINEPEALRGRVRRAANRGERERKSGAERYGGRQNEGRHYHRAAYVNVVDEIGRARDLVRDVARNGVAGKRTGPARGDCRGRHGKSQPRRGAARSTCRPCAGRGAERQPGDERGQRRRERVNRRTDRQRQDAGPDDLEHQRRKT